MTSFLVAGLCSKPDDLPPRPRTGGADAVLTLLTPRVFQSNCWLGRELGDYVIEKLTPAGCNGQATRSPRTRIVPAGQPTVKFLVDVFGLAGACLLVGSGLSMAIGIFAYARFLSF